MTEFEAAPLVRDIGREVAELCAVDRSQDTSEFMARRDSLAERLDRLADALEAAGRDVPEHMKLADRVFGKAKGPQGRKGRRTFDVIESTDPHGWPILRERKAA